MKPGKSGKRSSKFPADTISKWPRSLWTVPAGSETESTRRSTLLLFWFIWSFVMKPKMFYLWNRSNWRTIKALLWEVWWISWTQWNGFFLKFYINTKGKEPRITAASSLPFWASVSWNKVTKKRFVTIEMLSNSTEEHLVLGHRVPSSFFLYFSTRYRSVLYFWKLKCFTVCESMFAHFLMQFLHCCCGWRRSELRSYSGFIWSDDDQWSES